MNTLAWLKSAFRSTNRRRRTSKRRFATPQQAAEVLEHKTLLTGLTCLSQIEGTVFQDLSEDGLTGDDVRIGGASVHLYTDGGNGIFESSDGVAGGDDTFVITDTSDAVTGEYLFPDLAAGTYFVEQDSGLTGYIRRPGADVATVTITPVEAGGVTGTVIDEFSEPAIPQFVSDGTGAGASGSVAFTGLGGERDLYVERTSGALSVDFAVNAVPNTLTLGSGPGVVGFGVVTWDGIDGSATVDTSGLSVDLTSGGTATAFEFAAGGDFAGTLTLTVHSDATNSSTESISVPVATPGSPVGLLIPFTDFVGTADFSSIGAIELRIEGPVGFDGELQQFGTVGPTVKTANFVNFQPMTLGGTVFNDANNNATFGGSESGINGVDVSLFLDANSNGTFEPGAGDTQVGATTPTSGGGDYSFTGLFPGDYFIRVDASNFAAAAILEDFSSSTGQATDDATDNDDNGAPTGGAGSALASTVINLTNLAEPDVAVDGDDTNTNSTIDFGVFGTIDLTVGKSDSVDPVTAGSGANNLTYTITATNNGPLDATGVSVSDALIASLPTGWTVTGSSATAGTFDDGTGTWTVGGLANGVTETLTITLTVDSSAAAITTTNTANISGNELESNSGNNSASIDTTVQHVDVAVVKVESADPITAGSGPGNLTYTLTASNNGPGNATGVAVTDALIASLPTGWSVQGSTASVGSFDDGTGIWTVGNLANGDSETLTITLTVGSSAAASTTTNTAVISANEGETVTANNTSSVDTSVQHIDVAVVKAENADPITAGSGTGNLVYTLTATNNGPADATGVAVTDALIASLPAGWSVESTTPSAGTFDGGTGVWTIGGLANGVSETLTISITVGATASAGNTTNTAVISANEGETNTANNTSSVDTTIQLVDLTVVKAENADPITAGSGAGNLIYTVTATNNGPGNATGVAVTDALITSLPTGWSVAGTNPSTGTFVPGTGIWTIGNLASGISETLTITVTVGASASAGTTTNTVVIAGNEGETNTGNNTSSVDTTIQLVDLEIVKVDNPDPVTAGSGAGNLVYTLTASNNGPGDATGVAVTDALIASLPTGWSVAGSTASTGTFDAGTGLWTVGNLANGDSETLTIQITVAGNAAATSTNNTATIAANEGELDPSNNTSTVDTTVQHVDVAIVKTDSADPVTAGSGAGNLVYTLTATNPGNVNATGVSVTDALITSLPTGWSIAGNTPSTGSFDTGTGIWTIGNLSVGGSETLTISITVDSTAAAATTTNTAVISANESEIVTANNTSTIDTTVQQIDVTIAKSDSADPVTAGSGTGNLIYTLTATNNGPGNATGVNVTDALIASLPAGWSFVGANASAGTFVDSTGIWTIGNLANGDSETLDVTLTVGANAAATVTTNTAVIVANEGESNTGNNTSSIDTTIQLIDVAVTKTESADPVTAGSGTGNLVYTLTATNNGPGNATGVAVNDALIASLPTGWSIAGNTPSAGTFDTSTGVWTVGSLATGASETLQISVTVGASAAATTTTNTAIISANEGEVTTANNTSSVDTSVQHVDVQIVKTDSNDPVTAGSGTGNLVYTLTASNNGPGDATGVTATDALIASLPTGWSFVNANASTGSFTSSTGLWDIGNLASGDSELLTITVTVGLAAANETITNTAVITANEGETNTGNNTSSITTTVSEEVEIEVTKTASSATVVAGSGAGNLTYTITASNLGVSDATGVQITDQFLTALPTGIAIVSATPISDFNSSTGIWDVGSLPRGTSRDLTVALTVGAGAGAGPITNTAEVTAVDQPGDQTFNNVSTVITTIVHEVDLAVTKRDLIDPVTSPGQITYEIVATNNGPSIATNTVVTDTLPAAVSFVSAQSSQGTSVESGGVITSTLGTIAVGESVTTTVVVDVDLPFGGTVDNFVSILGDNEPAANLANNTDSEPTTVNPQVFEISGIVYQDLNGNDVQDAGEQSLNNVLVGLLGTVTRPNGSVEDVFEFVRTDASGNYSFSGLLQGDYNVFQVQPQLYETLNQIPGQANNGSGAVENLLQGITLSNVQTPTGATVNNNFTEGAVTETKIDFLASNQVVDPLPPIDPTATGSFSGRVVLDANANGIVDSDDEGIFRVPVTLAGFRSDTGAVIAVTALTDSDGNYSFTGVPAGLYNILQDQPNGFSSAGTVDGSVMSDRSQDNAFASIQLADGVQGTGFSFLERPEGALVLAAEAPVVASLPLETGTNPTLRWDPVLGAATYDIWLSQITGAAHTVYRNQAVAGTSIQIPVDLNLETHRMWVRGMNANGQPLTAWSAAHTFDVSPDIVVLSPTGNIIDTTPTFDWKDVGGATSYDLVLQDGAGNEVHSVEGISDSNYTMPTPLSGGSYQFFARAKNSTLTGRWSNGSDFSIGGVPAIVAPVTASVLADPLLEWTDIGADHYELWVNDVTSGSTFVCRETVDGTSMLMDHSLSGGQRYRFWVRGMDANGNASSWSSAQTFTMSNSPEITGPAGNLSGDTANISWNPVPGATHYYLWVSDENGAYIRDQNVQGHQYVASNLADGPYRAWVQAFGPLGKTGWSAASTFTVGGLDTPELQTPTGTIANRTVTFDWSDVSGTQTYEIWVNHIGVTNRVIHLQNLTDSTYTSLTDLAAGNYRWWVRAIGPGSIRSAWSAASDFVIS